MAKLLITTDAVLISNPATVLAQVDIIQTAVSRIRAAFGHVDPATAPPNPGPPVWVDATPQDVMDVLKAYLHGRVVDYETAKEANLKRAAVGGETW